MMLGRGLFVILLAACALANPITRDEYVEVALPPTAAVVKDTQEVAQDEKDIVQTEDQETIEETTEILIEEVAVKAAEETEETQVVEEPVAAPVVEDASTTDIISEDPVERVPTDGDKTVSSTTVEEESVKQEEEETEIKEELIAVQQDTGIVRDQTIVQESTDEPIQATGSEVELFDDEDASAIKKSTVVDEIEESTTAEPAEEESSVVEVRVEETIADQDESEQDVTEVPSSDLVRDESDVVTESEDLSSRNFRSENIEIEEITTEADEEAITTERSIPDTIEERVETATDTYFDDSTTEITIKEDITSLPEEISDAQTVVREIQADASEVSDVEVVATSVTDAPIQKSDDQQDAITEIVPEDIEVKKADETFDDAAPIAVVEIQLDETADAIIPEDSAPIEIVEIVDTPEPVVKAEESGIADETVAEDVPTESESDKTKESVDESEVRVVDKEVKDNDDSEKQQSETGKTKPVSSKVQPSVIDDEEYWLKMQQQAEESKTAEQSSTHIDTDGVEAEEKKDEIPSQSTETGVSKKKSETDTIEEPKDAEPAVFEVSAPEEVAVTNVDAAIEKVAQKYGLKSVEKINIDGEVNSEDSVLVSDDVLKEDPIYLESESRNDFQDSNDLQRRLTFGDKVVRFVRSNW